jgi:hypothetical protein
MVIALKKKCLRQNLSKASLLRKLNKYFDLIAKQFFIPLLEVAGSETYNIYE